MGTFKGKDVRSRSLDILIVAFSILVTFAYSGFAKPLWIDEYLHFAMGSLTLPEALQAIWESTGDGVNWGQTGTYLFLDYALGQAFGANLWALRPPSIAAGFILLLSAVWFLRVKGLSRFWQFLILIAFAGQFTLMSYVGEARPYMPFAASSIAVLAYYATPLPRRVALQVRLLGVFGILIGSLFHPYWLPSTVALLLFSIWIAARQGSIADWKDVLRFANLPLVLTGTLLYTAMAGLTWLRNSATAKVDPWEYIGGPRGFIETLVGTHLDFIAPQLQVLSFLASAVGMPTSIPRLVSLLILAAMTLGVLLSSSWRRALLEPMVLVWIGILSSVGIASLSLISEYWILQRQWLAGIAIVTVALVWGLGQLWRVYAKERSVLARWVVVVALILALVQFFNAFLFAIDRIQEHRNWLVEDLKIEQSRAVVVEEAFNDGDPARAGNLNITQGGAIWREHARYYGFQVDLE